MTRSNPDYFSKQVENEVRFCRTLKMESLLDLYVVSGGRETCQPGYNIKRGSFPYYALEYLHSGKGFVVLNNKKYSITAGSLFCYGPGVEHQMVNDSGEAMLKYFVDFSGPGAKKLVQSIGTLASKVVHNSMPYLIHQSFEELLIYGFNVSKTSDSLCRSLVKVLFYKLVENQLAHGRGGSIAHQTYIRSRGLIANKFLELHSLLDIAQECHIDASYLCRLFKLYDRETPYRFLQRLQMNYAADRMVKGGFAVNEISKLMGYNDQFHFSRAFKTIMGVSPQNFRNLTQYHKEN